MNKLLSKMIESHALSNWDSIHGCYSISRLVKMFKINTIAEVGVYCGHTASEVLRNTCVQKYSMIDPWDRPGEFLEHKNIYTFVREAFKDEQVEFIRKKSMDAIALFKDESLDMVYIDAGHTYERTKEDIHGWIKKIKHGGILAGDGYGDPSFPGVKQAVHEIFNDFEINTNKGPGAQYWVWRP